MRRTLARSSAFLAAMALAIPACSSNSGGSKAPDVSVADMAHDASGGDTGLADTKSAAEAVKPDMAPPTWSATLSLMQVATQGASPLYALVPHVSVDPSYGNPPPDVMTGAAPIDCVAYHFTATKPPAFLTGDAGMVSFTGWTGGTPASIMCTFGGTLPGYGCGSAGPVAGPLVKPGDILSSTIAGGANFGAIAPTAWTMGGSNPQVAWPDEVNFTATTPLNTVSTKGTAALTFNYQCATGAACSGVPGTTPMDPGVHIVLVSMQTTNVAPSPTDPFPTPDPTKPWGFASCTFLNFGAGSVQVPASIVNDLSDSSYTVLRTVIAGSAYPSNAMDAKGQSGTWISAMGSVGFSPNM